MRYGYLRLEFHDDSDGTGKLIATFEKNGFAGRGEDFADAIATFPLPTDKRHSLRGGFWKTTKVGHSRLPHSTKSILRLRYIKLINADTLECTFESRRSYRVVPGSSHSLPVGSRSLRPTSHCLTSAKTCDV